MKAIEGMTRVMTTGMGGLASGLLTVLVGVMAPLAARAGQPTATQPKATIVLVHGAFADGSSWSRVIPLLQKEGYKIVAVQSPLITFAGDVEVTKRVIDAQKGPVIAVGHSYGGAVISAAAAGSPNVKALVYITAFAPEAGEVFSDLYGKYGQAPAAAAFTPDAAGFLYVDPARFHEVFANDVSASEAAVLAATQKPVQGAIFGQKLETPAWKTIPSWYLVTLKDQAIKVELQRFMAKRAGAKVTELDASHVPFLSHPKEVAHLINTAARAAIK